MYINTSFPIRVSVDFANKEAAHVKLAISLLGDAHHGVSSTPQPFHSVRGGVCSGLC